MVAAVLGLATNAVTVECRRMGGAFGGKETQAQPVRRRRRAGRDEDRPRRQDPARSRRRHDRHRQAPRLPWSTMPSVSTPTAASWASMLVSPPAAASPPTCRGRVTDRALFHADNCYYYPAVPHRLAAAPDQHGLQHRLSRLRRPAGHGRRRARAGGDRLRGRHAIRSRSGSVNFYGPAATSRPITRPSRTTSSRPRCRRARGEFRLSGPPHGHPRVQRQQPRSSSAASP